MTKRLLFLLTAVAAMAQFGLAQEAARVEGKNIRIEIDRSMHSRVVAKFDDGDYIIGDCMTSQSIQVSGTDVKDFAFQSSKVLPMGPNDVWTQIIGTAPS